MRIELVEIYSDASNAAVMRHPGRRFPGILMQGDSLHVLCHKADIACDEIRSTSPGYAAANNVRNALWSYLQHYKTTLAENNIKLPFSETGR